MRRGRRNTFHPVSFGRMNSEPDVPWWLGLHSVRRPHPDEAKHREGLELLTLFAELGPEDRLKLLQMVKVLAGRN